MFIFSIMEGGAETGFRHVKPEEYKPRLLHFKAVNKKIALRQVGTDEMNKIFKI